MVSSGQRASSRCDDNTLKIAKPINLMLLLKVSVIGRYLYSAMSTIIYVKATIHVPTILDAEVNNNK